jgi:hypothetical protein
MGKHKDPDSPSYRKFDPAVDGSPSSQDGYPEDKLTEEEKKKEKG